MDSAPHTPFDWHGAKALLEWYVELGAVDAVGDTPVDRYALADSAPVPRRKAGANPAAPPAAPAPRNPEAEALALAEAAGSLEALADAIHGFDGLAIKRGARNFVFADGNPRARVMIVGEAPGGDEDRAGRPFVGRAGQLLDRMFAAIGLTRDHPDAAHALYITNVLPWRPPANRTPTRDEVAIMRPVLRRHVALADPDVVVVMGNAACDALLGRSGITRLRGRWVRADDRAVMPMVHPAYLLRNPEAKREAWADLLEIQAKLRGTP